MLKGKAAIVTGSTSGIGLGIARALAEVRCNIMLNGFGEASVIEHERGKLATEFGVKVSFNGADLSKPTEVSKMIEAATLELGQVDILVNSGIQHTAPVEHFRSTAGMRLLPSTCHLTFTRSVPSYRRCASEIGDASSTSLRHTGL